MSEVDKVLYITIFVYMMIMVLVIAIKPEFLYDKKEKRFRDFGMGRDNSIFALPEFGMIMSVMVYLVSLLYVTVLTKLK